MAKNIGFYIVVFFWAPAALAERFDRQIPMVEKPASTFYVDGHLDGYGPIEMMVDTGSSFTTINERALTALKANGQATYLRELTGVMADGSKTQVAIYRVKGLRIGNDCQLQEIDTAVFPGDTRFILGLSALRRTSPFVFSSNPPTLILSHCDSPLAWRSGVTDNPEQTDVNQSALSASP